MAKKLQMQQHLSLKFITILVFRLRVILIVPIYTANAVMQVMRHFHSSLLPCGVNMRIKLPFSKCTLVPSTPMYSYTSYYPYLLLFKINLVI